MMLLIATGFPLQPTQRFYRVPFHLCNVWRQAPPWTLWYYSANLLKQWWIPPWQALLTWQSPSQIPTAINMFCHSTLLNWIQQQMLLHGNFNSFCLLTQTSICWIHSQCSWVIIPSLCTIHSPLDQVFICLKIKPVQVLWVHWEMPWSFLKLAPTTWPDWKTIRMESCSSDCKYLLSCCF